MARQTRPSKRTTIPRSVCVIAVALVPATAAGTSSCTPLTLSGVSFVTHRRVHGRWVLHSEGDYTDADSFWAGYSDQCDPGTECYTVCPEAGSVLGVLGWWDLLRDQTVECVPRGTPASDGGGTDGATGPRGRDTLILSGEPDVISFRIHNRPCRWVGVRNFGDPGFQPTGDPHADCRLYSAWFRQVLDRWQGAACGIWRDTAGAASWSTYTMRAVRVRITDHQRADALKLEDAACHGGRSSIFTTNPIGNRATWDQFPNRPAYPDGPHTLTGPAHRIDVRAMYPTIMRDQLFPVRLVGVSHGWTPDRLARVAESLCVVARVRVRSCRACLPRKSGDTAGYPVGEWVTTLATPEIRAAAERNEIVRVYEVARYEPGEPFRDWGRWVLGLRARAKVIGDQSWSGFVKKMAVSLSGRLARRAGGWVHRPGVIPPVGWGEWIRRDAETQVDRRFRCLGGIVQELVVEDSRPGTYAACYAHVTSHGRVQMDRYRERSGFRTVVAQHTDGLVVTGSGLASLEQHGAIRRGTWGHLQYEGSYQAAWYRTPNHFWHDGYYTCAGLNAHHWVGADGALYGTELLDPARSACDPSKNPLIERVKRIELGDVCPGETAGPDGWVVPPVAGRGPLTASET